MTRNMLVLAVAGVLSLLGCGLAGADETGPLADSLTLSGSVGYRERMALPPDAVLTVSVEDVSLADAPAVTLARTEFTADGRQSPFPFSMTYPTPVVRPGSVYAVRARITVGDRLLFTTMERIKVDPLNPSPIDVIVTRVGTTDTPPVPDASLTDTYWKLIEVQGQPVQVLEGMREPNLVLRSGDNRVAGSGGVNRLMGGYTVAGDSLVFSQMASTMMAGPPESMQQEQTILATLPAVRGFAITGDNLTLLNESGTPVVKAVAVAFG